MGAHSGTSSDDIVLMLAYFDENSGIIFNIGLERHGIKSMIFPRQFMNKTLLIIKIYLKE